MTTEIEKIASKHLGKAGDGSIVKPYVTPETVDPSLLVGVPRELNRVQYGITAQPPFVGVDAWNAYEFSTLLKNGYPVSGWMKLNYSAYTPNIVESKSLKLYLNSYNMARIVDDPQDMNAVISRVMREVSNAVGGWVDVQFRADNDPRPFSAPILGPFIRLEDLVDVTRIPFEHYNEDPSILNVTENTYMFPQAFRTSVLRSNCRVTNQPDWGDVFIYIDGNQTVTPGSLLQYIVSMRKENHFHEEVCECIYKRLFDKLTPRNLFVGCLYTRRGGIDINPIRASSYELMNKLAPIADEYNFCEKTLRQ